MISINLENKELYLLNQALRNYYRTILDSKQDMIKSMKAESYYIYENDVKDLYNKIQQIGRITPSSTPETEELK